MRSTHIFSILCIGMLLSGGCAAAVSSRMKYDRNVVRDRNGNVHETFETESSGSSIGTPFAPPIPANLGYQGYGWNAAPATGGTFQQDPCAYHADFCSQAVVVPVYQAAPNPGSYNNRGAAAPIPGTHGDAGSTEKLNNLAREHAKTRAVVKELGRAQCQLLVGLAAKAGDSTLEKTYPDAQERKEAVDDCRQYLETHPRNNAVAPAKGAEE